MKSIIQNLMILVVSTVIMLFVAEGVVRWTMPQTIMPRFMVNSGFGNRVPAADKSYQHSVPGEYTVDIHTNSFGGRGSKDYSEAKPSGTYRICFLGDSFTFGYGVTDSEVVSAVAENLLNRQIKSQNFEVLNFGVSGYGQAEQYNLYLNRVSRYSCDDVFVFYFSNDPGNNVISGLFKIGDDGALERDNAEYLPGVKIQETLYGAPLLGGLIAHSHLWSIVRNRASAMIHRQMLSKKGLTSYSTKDDTPRNLTVALFGAFEKRLKDDGVGFGVFVIPGAKLETNYPAEMLSGLSERTILGSQILAQEDYYVRDGHWKASGHEKAARAITEFYQSRLNQAKEEAVAQPN